MKSFNTCCLLAAVALITNTSVAQYTRTINTNTPGRSQGAFSVGTMVLQGETSAFYRTEEHELQMYERDVLGLSYQLRFGAFLEELEFSYIGEFSSATETQLSGTGNVERSFANLSRSTLGAKYMVFDPIKKWGEKEVNIRSWKANQKFRWRDLIPAVSVYAGANLFFSEPNSFTPPDNPSVSPRVELITQNNYGRWVLVTNIIADMLGSDFSSYQGIATITHSFNNRYAGFIEFQTIIGDFYSDELLRAGGAMLLNRNWQIDAGITTNFKDTPTVFQINLGMSYRLDWHKDKIVESDNLDDEGPNIPYQ
ncbi:MAG: transporter [Nonlabens sp.]